MTKVTLNAPSSVLVKRKRDDAAVPSGHKKSKAPISLRVLRRVVGLMTSASCLLIEQEVPPAPPAIEAHATATVETVNPVIPAFSPRPIADVVQEVAPTTTEVIVPTTQAGSAIHRRDSFIKCQCGDHWCFHYVASFIDSGGSPCCCLESYGVAFFILVPSHLPGSFVHLYLC